MGLPAPLAARRCVAAAVLADGHPRMAAGEAGAKAIEAAARRRRRRVATLAAVRAAAMVVATTHTLLLLERNMGRAAETPRGGQGRGQGGQQGPLILLSPGAWEVADLGCGYGDEYRKWHLA